jgi:hypothetical protein
VIEQQCGTLNAGCYRGEDIGLLVGAVRPSCKTLDSAVQLQKNTKQAVIEINNAIVAHNIPVDGGIAMLAGVAARAPDVQPLVTNETGALVANGQLTGTQAVADVHGALSVQNLSASQIVTVLTGLALSSNASLQSAVTADIVSMVANHQITADNAVATLAGAAGHGSVALAIAAGNEVAALVSGKQISAQMAVTDLGRAGPRALCPRIKPLSCSPRSRRGTMPPCRRPQMARSPP